MWAVSFVSGVTPVAGAILPMLAPAMVASSAPIVIVVSAESICVATVIVVSSISQEIMVEDDSSASSLSVDGTADCGAQASVEVDHALAGEEPELPAPEEARSPSEPKTLYENFTAHSAAKHATTAAASTFIKRSGTFAKSFWHSG